jgi:hypothetical protein
MGLKAMITKGDGIAPFSGLVPPIDLSEDNNDDKGF